MNSKHIFSNKKKAFTLIELLIVIAVIGILFIVIVSRVDFATDKAKTTGVQTDFRSFQMAFDTVAREHGGFNSFGFNTGDNAGAIPAGYAFETEALRKATMGDGKRNSFDSGDKNLNGKKDTGEVWNGHKIHTEEWTEVYTLIKPGTSAYDANAIIALENAINANLDPKLQITISTDGTITMANHAVDPWKNEYTGVYISNADNYDAADRGAIVMFCAGADGELHSEASISGGVVSINNPSNDKRGQDDYSIVSCYSFYNGYGEVKNMTTGFGANTSWLGSTGSNQQVVIPGGNGGNAGGQVQGPGESGYTMLDMPNGTVSLASPITFRSSADYSKFKSVKIDGVTMQSYKYWTDEGSIIVVIPGNYVNELSNGAHTIEIVSTDGSAKANFNVQIECRNHKDYYYDEYYDEYYYGDDGYCDYCGVNIACYWNYCQDDDGDCHCDWCGSDWDMHRDWQDYDGYCDNCGALVACQYGGPCIQEEGSCWCWYCGNSFHYDNNVDGYCDTCDCIYCDDGGPCHPYAYGCWCEWCGRDIHHISSEGCYCTMCWYETHSDNNSDGYCDTCNYAGGCYIGGPCIFEDGSCYSVCCGYPNHEGYEDNGVCDKCGYVDCYETGYHGSTDSDCLCDCCCEVQVHKNNNDDCSCDKCGVDMHIDADKNSYCDRCDIVYCKDSTNCIDLDGDCRCDWCNLPKHASVNSNNYCNICGRLNEDGRSIETAYAISSGSSMTANISAGQYVYFKFTATESGTYKFYSTRDLSKEYCDPYGYLVNGNGSELAKNDDGNGNMDFSISKSLNAGETVYLKVKLYNTSQSSSYLVTVEQA